MRTLFLAAALLVATTAASAEPTHVQVDSVAPANFYLAKCTLNTRSIMGRIPARTRLRVVMDPKQQVLP